MKLEFYLVIFVAFFAILLRLGKRRRESKFKKSGRDAIPYVQFTGFNLPLVEGLISFYKLRKYGVEVFEQYVNSGLKFAKVGVAHRTVFVTADTEVTQKVLKSPSPDHLGKPKMYYELFFSHFMEEGLLAGSVNTWIPHRKAAGLAFTYKSLGIYLQYINQNVKELVHQVGILADQGGKGTADNSQFGPLFDHCVVQLITQILMGSECATFSEQEINDFHEGFRVYKEIGVSRFLNPLLVVPPIWWLHPKRRELDRAAVTVLKLANKVVKNYRAKQQITKVDLDLEQDDPGLEGEAWVEGITGGKIEDINKNATGKKDGEDDVGAKPFGCVVEQLIATGLTDKEIADEIGTFLTAGHETIRVAMDFLIFHLAAHPDHQRKCQVEVDQLFDSAPGGDSSVFDAADISMEDLSSLKYLERCILESLRLSPTVPFFGRQLAAPLQISEEVTLNTDEIIIMLPWGIHRDPENFPQPRVFDPDRFLAENVKKRHPYSYLPFSMGSRNCIGWKLALLELKIITAMLLRYFNLSTTDGLHDLKIFFDITIHPERPYDITFEKRSHS